VIKDIDNQIYYDKKECPDDYATQDDGIVPFDDPLHGKTPYPVPAENCFSEHRTVQITSKIESYDGDKRN